MATIRKLSSGAYQAIVRKKGHPAASQTFRTKREAQTWADIKEGDISAGRAHGAAHAHRFDELLKKYREGPLNELRSSDDRERDLKLWETALSDRRLAEITPDLIASTLREYAATPVVRMRRVRGGKLEKAERPRSSQTVRHAHMALSAILDYAHKDLHWLKDNPAHKTRRAAPAPAHCLVERQAAGGLARCLPGERKP